MKIHGMPGWALMICLTAFTACGCNQEPATGPSESTGAIVSGVSTNGHGPVVHAVEGSAIIKYEGKNVTATISAHQYADGSVAGEYEVNMQSSFQSKWHGNVVFLKVYSDVPGYATLAVVGGQIQSSSDTSMIGRYDCNMFVDNGKDPDLTNGLFPLFKRLDRAELFWASDPLDLINGFTTSWGYEWPGMNLAMCDKGNLHVR